MHYTHDLRRRVTVSPSLIISQKFGSNVEIVNICVGLTECLENKASMSLFVLAKAVQYIQCIFSFCSKLKTSLETVLSGDHGEVLPRVGTPSGERDPISNGGAGAGSWAAFPTLCQPQLGTSP